MEEKLDRRSRKTRAVLLKELTALLNEKDIKDISVKELSERADINRGTFYLHYSDVFDMLHKVEEELFEKFNKIFYDNVTDLSADTALPLLQDLFHEIEREKELTKIFLGPHGDIAFIHRMTDLVSKYIASIWEVKACKHANLNYFNAFIISGCVGLIKEWVNEDDQKTPEEMAQLCSQIVEQALAIFAG